MLQMLCENKEQQQAAMKYEGNKNKKLRVLEVNPRGYFLQRKGSYLQHRMVHLDTEILRFGRHPSLNIVLNSIKASRLHLKIYMHCGRVFLRDMSTNGTWINNERIMGEVRELFERDLISVGIHPMRETNELMYRFILRSSYAAKHILRCRLLPNYSLEKYFGIEDEEEVQEMRPVESNKESNSESDDLVSINNDLYPNHGSIDDLIDIVDKVDIEYEPYEFNIDTSESSSSEIMDSESEDRVQFLIERLKKDIKKYKRLAPPKTIVFPAIPIEVEREIALQRASQLKKTIEVNKLVRAKKAKKESSKSAGENMSDTEESDVEADGYSADNDSENDYKNRDLNVGAGCSTDDKAKVDKDRKSNSSGEVIFVSLTMGAPVVPKPNEDPNFPAGILQLPAHFYRNTTRTLLEMDLELNEKTYCRRRLRRNQTDTSSTDEGNRRCAARSWVNTDDELSDEISEDSQIDEYTDTEPPKDDTVPIEVNKPKEVLKLNDVVSISSDDEDMAIDEREEETASDLDESVNDFDVSDDSDDYTDITENDDEGIEMHNSRRNEPSQDGLVTEEEEEESAGGEPSDADSSANKKTESAQYHRNDNLIQNNNNHDASSDESFISEDYDVEKIPTESAKQTPTNSSEGISSSTTKRLYTIKQQQNTEEPELKKQRQRVESLDLSESE